MAGIDTRGETCQCMCMENTFSIGVAARRLGRTVKTLQRWDRLGMLRAIRTATGRRVYTDALLRQALGLKPDAATRVTLAYCRVSSQSQRPDLKNQLRVVGEFATARGLANVEFVQEIGGGLNFKRPHFLRLVDRIIAGEVAILILAHRDRLARFGFELLAHLCEVHDCQLLVLGSEQLSPEAEMVQDLLTIVHCFSSRLYGLRNYRKSLKAAIRS